MYLLKNFTVASNDPSLPALTLGSLYKGWKFRRDYPYINNSSTHHIATDGKPVRAAVPVGALISGDEFSSPKDLVRFRLRFEWELRVRLAAVDQKWCLRLFGIFLHKPQLVNMSRCNIMFTEPLTWRSSGIRRRDG